MPVEEGESIMRLVPGMRVPSSDRGQRLLARGASFIAVAAVLLLGVQPASAVGATFTPASVAIEEGGATATYEVSLPTEPTDDVVMSITPADGQVTVDPTSLTFTPGDFDEPQQVTVTAVDDDVDEASPHATSVGHEGASNDADYKGDLGSVTVDITDDDQAGITLIETDGSTDVGEGGASDSYTITLDSEPTADVTIDLTHGDGQVIVDPVQLTFTAGDWELAQTITVDAVDDDLAEGAHQALINHDATSSDPASSR